MLAPLTFTVESRTRAPGAVWRVLCVFYALCYAEQCAAEFQAHDDSSDYRVCAV